MPPDPLAGRKKEEGTREGGRDGETERKEKGRWGANKKEKGRERGGVGTEGRLGPSLQNPRSAFDVATRLCVLSHMPVLV